MVKCRSHCGATFHLCKEEEHQLLCPMVQVPCINSAYGCPFSMLRYKLAKHLKVCPASVVCCSMEWNRFPNIDSCVTLHENIMREEHAEECLDTALALRDQRTLFESLTMSSLFPELVERSSKLEDINGDTDLEEGATGCTAYPPGESGPDEAGGLEMKSELSQSDYEELAASKEGMDLSQYQRWEVIFSKERSAAEHFSKQANSKKEKDETKNVPGASEDISKKEAEPTAAEPKIEEQRNIEVEKTGFAPWQDGVLDRLKKEAPVSEYNMYLVHHGRMLIHFGQMAACTPKEKDFVYGNLEAQELKTVSTFKVPTSYRSGCRLHIGSEGYRRKKAHKGVDTSDLVITQDEKPKCDAIKTALICSLEKELKVNSISQMSVMDGLLIDIATQTYDFGLAPFLPTTVLADVNTENSHRLHLGLQSECVTRRHNKNSSSFTFTCNHFFRRDEFPSHFKNVHSDVQSSLNGWFQLRCPLSYLGCTFVQNQFRPSGQRSKIIYSKEVQTFANKPHVSPVLCQGVKANLSRSRHGKSKDALSVLPLEILHHIASFLDSFSLSQLSQVSCLMRDVSSVLLQERGMVLLKWERKSYSHGGASWKPRSKVWQFSSLFSTVSKWQFEDIPPMSEHLKTCPFYAVEHKTDPFPLTSMRGPKERARRPFKDRLVNFRQRV
ncbi:F-box only protein 40 isoform X2 [Ambystoma mexicanum]